MYHCMSNYISIKTRKKLQKNICSVKLFKVKKENNLFRNVVTCNESLHMNDKLKIQYNDYF